MTGFYIPNIIFNNIRYMDNKHMTQDVKENNKKFLQSYLYTEHGDYFISTIYRRSSAMLAPDSWYYETFAWKMENNERTEWVEDNSGAISRVGAIKQHLETINKLEANL